MHPTTSWPGRPVALPAHTPGSELLAPSGSNQSGLLDAIRLAPVSDPISIVERATRSSSCGLTPSRASGSRTFAARRLRQPQLADFLIVLVLRLHEKCWSTSSMMARRPGHRFLGRSLRMQLPRRTNPRKAALVLTISASVGSSATTAARRRRTPPLSGLPDSGGYD